MNQADKAIRAFDEIAADSHPGHSSGIELIYDALEKLKKMEEEAVAKSWEGAVDRQGGSFTQDEIDQREQW